MPISEDFRARNAARVFRGRLVVEADEALPPASWIVRQGERLLGIDHVSLPPHDPLLAGATALLDREFETIWIRNDLSPTAQALAIAHELGHFILHPAGDYLIEGEELGTVDGYSQHQRDERDAHHFAAEFLLPAGIARKMFFDGCCGREIARQAHLPSDLVYRQLLESLGETDLLYDDFSQVVDRWQEDAARTRGSALVVGGRGTGRTTALIARCRVLVEEERVDPRSIVVFAQSRESADALRRQLFIVSNANTSLISVMTPGQFAYDIVARFGGPSREGDQPKILSRALAILDNNAAASGLIARRFAYVLIDDLDLMGDVGAKLALKNSGKMGGAIWVVAQKQSLSFTELLPPNIRIYALPNQYRRVAVLNSFVMDAEGRKRKELTARVANGRAGVGSITLAVATSISQGVSGVAEFVDERFAAGYLSEEVIVVCPDAHSGGTLAALAKALSPNPSGGFDSVFADDFLAFLDVCHGKCTLPSFVRVAQFDEYRIPLSVACEIWQRSQAVELQRGLRSLLTASEESGAQLLETHLALCQRSVTMYGSLQEYLFNASDYLRHKPGAYTAARQLMAQLKRERQAIPLEDIRKVLKGRSPRFLSSSSYNLSRNAVTLAGQDSRWHPIVIVMHCDLENLMRKTTASDNGVLDNVELLCGKLATDHLLYCVVSKTPEQTKSLAVRLGKKFNGLTVVDWTSRRDVPPTPPGPEARHELLPDCDIHLFRQCPRRLYYKRGLQESGFIDRIDSKQYPAAPADGALCDTCDYARLCPSPLR